MPRVTVVIPNYNHAKYLASRIDSVLAQTYRDFDVVLLDDASTDDSASVIAGYADRPGIRVIPNAVNSGSTFKQWNRGVREAGGELVWIAESDDWADPRLLGTLVTALDASPDIGVAYCGSWKIAPDGTRIGCVTDELPAAIRGRWTTDFTADGQDEIRRYMRFCNSILNASAVLFRKTIYDRVGGADEGYRVCGDWKLWIDLLAKSNVSFTAERLNNFRYHPGNVRTLVAPTKFLPEAFRIFRHVVDIVDLTPAEREAYCQRNFNFFLRADLLAAYPPEFRWLLLRHARRIDPGLRSRYTQAKARTAARIAKNWIRSCYQKSTP